MALSDDRSKPLYSSKLSNVTIGLSIDWYRQIKVFEIFSHLQMRIFVLRKDLGNIFECGIPGCKWIKLLFRVKKYIQKTFKVTIELELRLNFIQQDNGNTHTKLYTVFNFFFFPINVFFEQLVELIQDISRSWLPRLSLKYKKVLNCNCSIVRVSLFWNWI